MREGPAGASPGHLKVAAARELAAAARGSEGACRTAHPGRLVDGIIDGWDAYPAPAQPLSGASPKVRLAQGVCRRVVVHAMSACA